MHKFHASFYALTLQPPATRQLSRCLSSFKASHLEITNCPDHQKQPKPDPKNIVFGQNFTNHMLEIEWTEVNGWSNPKISPLHNFSLHPSAKVLHYANECFEGQKAYRGVDGRIRLFRPEMNMKRMNRSASRCCMPNFDGEELITCISELIKLDQEFVLPAETKTALYIRPFMFGTEAALGVSKSKTCLLSVILSPVGSYFSPGSQIKHVNLMANPSYVRAWPGGTGDHKMGSNYAPTIKIQEEAVGRGLQQVLWLHGPDHEVTEVGTMNIFIVVRGSSGKLQLITPPLGRGLILPGIVRDSILTIARTWDEVEVVERFFTMNELKEMIQNQTLVEMFGAGTACVVSPIGVIDYMGEKLCLPTGEGGLSEELHRKLDRITYGVEDPFSWCRIVC
jgi:branched-chain amino acid aminotransferase